MNVAQRLTEIWNSDYIRKLSEEQPFLSIRERGYAFAENSQQRDILVTGINPSFRETKQANECSPLQWKIEDIWSSPKHDNYWSLTKSILHDDHIDLLPRAGYLDIFYFREQNQKFLEAILSKPEGIRFVAEQLNLTMHIIEEIVKPKLIVVKNKGSWAYFGKYAQENGWIWMGYAFEPIRILPCGELCMIRGLIDSPERIALEITQTELVGTLVLFTKHLTYIKKEERPTPSLLQELLNSLQQ